MTPPAFIPQNPSVEDCWRGIVLYGDNSATYKFALAESLLKLRPRADSLIKLEDLAPVYGQAIAAHIGHSPKQGTNPGKFLKAVETFTVEANLEALTKATLADGFNHVLDRFHNVRGSPVLHKFFRDERQENKGIRVTEELEKLLSSMQVGNIAAEVDSRWRLVETAWNLGISANHLVVQHDALLEAMCATDTAGRRKSVTSTRSALNGYQKGKCFYCFADLRLLGEDFNTDVDHFFPHSLGAAHAAMNLDGVWNLVLACKSCNRGPNGKFDRIPSLTFLERLSTRNEYLIASEHPLRETLINQSGKTKEGRRDFLNTLYRRVNLNPAMAWEPETTFSEDPFIGSAPTGKHRAGRQGSLF